ncbi:MAG: hypothetical protein AAFX50_21360, partial [Acidobacteriota bacterium]
MTRAPARARARFLAYVFLVAALSATSAIAQEFCVGDAILNQPSVAAFPLVSESTCGACVTDQLVRAQVFLVDRPRLVTELTVWGYYLDERVPDLETWTVAFHDDDPSTRRPAGAFSVQTVVPASRAATGNVSVQIGLTEYQWRLRLDEPVAITPEVAGERFWVEIFHDSPDAEVVAALSAFPGFSVFSEASAPGSGWIEEDFGVALQVCALDARWNSLVVPLYRVDPANPADATLLAARNTSDRRLGLEVAYFDSGGRIEDGPLRADRFVLEPRATRPVNVNVNTAGLDPDQDGRIEGFITVRELDLVTDEVIGVANLTGDFSRVDFTNDFAAGERMIAPDAFCETQEIRVVDFGSGSEFNVVLRDPPRNAGDVAYEFSIVDEAGNELISQIQVETTRHTNLIP